MHARAHASMPSAIMKVDRSSAVTASQIRFRNKQILNFKKNVKNSNFCGIPRRGRSPPLVETETETATPQGKASQNLQCLDPMRGGGLKAESPPSKFGRRKVPGANLLGTLCDFWISSIIWLQIFSRPRVTCAIAEIQLLLGALGPHLFTSLFIDSFLK